ncbi:endoribonuclease xendoU domain-containing protein [Ditylenchus destructor]|uniref:Endoribonuclease xendoU domain-containing protein n=1 Tax=Ditylenchus destructor TaxID=166010 RepID=A0AAD4QYA9_9BILA|nr:endoribonuclease xendoU domain-containing protein [Ditylenchus destructor]
MYLGISYAISLSFLFISTIVGLNGESSEKLAVGKGKQEVSKFLNKIVFSNETRNSDAFINSKADENAEGQRKHSEHRRKHSKTNTNDPELRELVTQLWKSDEDNRVTSDTIVFNYGNHTDGTKDVSPNPLFVKVDEAFLEKPIYAALINVYNATLFHPPVCIAEDAMAGARQAALENFLNVITNTSTFQLAYDFLKARNKTGPDYDTFHKDLFNLWFGTYSRCNETLGSSGWEHVFLGEYRLDRQEEIVDGQHYWVRYYLEEKTGHINYHGYHAYDEGLLATIQYTWNGYLKKVGGFLLRSSPAFDMSLFTVCSLTHVGNEKCKFKIEDNEMFVSSFIQKCDAGRCLDTSYPGTEKFTGGNPDYVEPTDEPNNDSNTAYRNINALLFSTGMATIVLFMCWF